MGHGEHASAPRAPLLGDHAVGVHAPASGGLATAGDPHERTRRLSSTLSTTAATPLTPRPRHVRLIFWLLGVGTLLPWNATLTAVDFFRMEFPNEGNPDLWFTGLFQAATMGVMMALVPLGSLLVFRSRFIAGYVAYIALLVALPLLTLLGDRSLSWALVLITMPIFGAATGLVESSMYGYAALVDDAAVTFAQVGESSSGLLVSLLQIATKAAFPSTRSGQVDGAAVYFGSSAAICVVCIVMFLCVPWLSHDTTARDDKVDWSKARQALRQNWQMCAAICTNYAVSLSIFPGLVTTIKPSSDAFGNGWLPVLLITLFNLGDSCGRFVRNFGVRLTSPLQVLVLDVLRVAFLPLFALLVNGTISNDVAAMAATLALGVTNGFVSVNCMVHGRSMVHRTIREEGGYILTLSMSIGITAGVFLALPLNYWIAGQAL